MQANNMATRAEMLRKADDILKANPAPRPTVRIRYRGGRPAWNWLRKHDEKGAAALWLVARERLPQAANDNLPTEAGLHVDRRPDGKPRGKNPGPQSIEAYLALPAVAPRLGDAEPEEKDLRGWFPWFDLKPQRHSDDFELYPRGRFVRCKPGTAPGAIFLGAKSGLGKPKMGKSRGDIRRVDAPDFVMPPPEVDTVIEVMLSGGNVADVGKALGAKGGYADRRGGAALLAAGRWANEAIAA